MTAPSGSSDSGGAFSRPQSRHAAGLTLVSVLAVVLLGLAPASATWSIVGVDPDTGEVGVAIASCVPGVLLGDLDQPLEPVVLVPGVGAGVSQAALNSDAPPEMRRLIAAGEGADSIVSAITAPEFDNRSEERQHALVLLDGDGAGFTGLANQSVALDRPASLGWAQGNILVSEAVIDDSVSAFETTEGDLASKLVAALQAGGDAGGDSRCGEQTALFAHVVVADREDPADAPSVLLSVSVVEGDGQNPVALLSEAFEAGERNWVSGPTFIEEFGPSLAVLGLGVILLVGLVIAVRSRRRASA